MCWFIYDLMQSKLGCNILKCLSLKISIIITIPKLWFCIKVTNSYKKKGTFLKISKVFAGWSGCTRLQPVISKLMLQQNLSMFQKNWLHQIYELQHMLFEETICCNCNLTDHPVSSGKLKKFHQYYILVLG